MNSEEYSIDLVKRAENLDKVMGYDGVFKKLADIITKNGDSKSAASICVHIKRIADKNDRELNIQARALIDSMIRFYGHEYLSEIYTAGTAVEKTEENSLEELVNELKSLTGLDKVKAKVNDLIDFHKIQSLRRSVGLSTHKNTLHMAFTGNPGTGKTTVARIIGRMYKQLGLLSKGHFLEVSRTDLIAGYQGQTALKVKSLIEKAKGGVLFIDEAYSITENDHSDSYGRECLTELTKALEDYRDDLVVIVAGYTEPMRKFFDSNPGLKSRFSTFIEFDDYNVEELLDIFEGLCRKEDYKLSSSAKDSLCEIMSENLANNEGNFANGRYVRNTFEEMIINQSHRLSAMLNPSKEDLELFTNADLPKRLSFIPTKS